MIKLGLGHTRPSDKLVTETLYLRVKQPGHDHSPLSVSCLELKPTLTDYSFMEWCLIKHGNNFTFLIHSLTVSSVTRIL